MPPPHVFVDALRPCLRTINWPHDESCHLLGDNLPELERFARSIGLHTDWLQWSAKCVPHFDLTRHMRLKALLAGADEISDTDSLILATFWVDRHKAVLQRMVDAAPSYAPPIFGRVKNLLHDSKTRSKPPYPF